MKGSELLGQIVALLVLVGISFVAGGLILWVMNITEDTAWGSTYALTLNPIHQPIKYEIMIMGFMETTHNGITTKEIILKAIETCDNSACLTDIEIGDNTFDIRAISKSVFDNWFEETPYLFMIEIDDIKYRLAGASTGFIDYEDNRISVKTMNIPIKTATTEGALILYVE